MTSWTSKTFRTDHTGTFDIDVDSGEVRIEARPTDPDAAAIIMRPEDAHALALALGAAAAKASNGRTPHVVSLPAESWDTIADLASHMTGNMDQDSASHVVEMIEAVERQISA